MKYTLFLFLFFSVTILSCTKEAENNPYKGLWIRMDNPTDTLSFGIEFSEGFFVLKRGFEPVNGNILPKAGSGPYMFRIIKDSIDILPAWSSAMVYRRYYFRVKGNEMEIGDFFEGAKPVMTFRKL